jgi:hypothetical protein
MLCKADESLDSGSSSSIITHKYSQREILSRLSQQYSVHVDRFLCLELDYRVPNMTTQITRRRAVLQPPLC